jgi:hypothetical protein
MRPFLALAVGALFLAIGCISPQSTLPGDEGQLSTPLPEGQSPVPRNLKVAFIADQGTGDASRAVLQLIKSEGADMVLHQGDLDYHSDPEGWDRMITDILGPDFPYFVSVGNHDLHAWPGYQRKLLSRLSRVEGAACYGELGVRSACTYRGLFFILSGVGTLGSGHDAFIRDQLSRSNFTWRICSWHKNQRLMQVGGKGDEVGWEPYEECRRGGAIIATGHEHSYSRTHLISSFENQAIASTSDTLGIARGRTVAFVSGLGGRSIRGQDKELAGMDWWAAVYTRDQGADYGALFCTFNGDRAGCYFKDISGRVPDEFELISLLAPGAS